MSKGAVCNLTRFWMCAHNGTHEDAPAHFIADGRTVEQMDLQDCIGDAYVIPGGEGWEERIPEGCERLLIRGPEAVTLEPGEGADRQGDSSCSDRDTEDGRR